MEKLCIQGKRRNAVDALAQVSSDFNLQYILATDQKHYRLIETSMKLLLENNPQIVDNDMKEYLGIIVCNLCHFPGLRLAQESLTILFELLK